MRYMLLIYSNEAESANASPEETQAMMGSYFAFNDAISKQGVHVSSEALHETNQACTVRVRNGKPLITDGPFAETKEQLGGYYLVDCKDLDEALQIAAQCPGAHHGSIEVRPVVDFTAMQG